ncbi:hypothetical protein [Paenibacillus sp. GCM10023250]|uniref:hypothetical protein n=1 Tax=Paenibacillus sp. GCM10023250 TaxID=3252648 RepID=UPI00360B448C
MKRRSNPFVRVLLLSALCLLPAQAAGAAQAHAASSEQLLNAFDGTIRDFDAARILWAASDGSALWLHDRLKGGDVKIYDASGTDTLVGPAQLSASGVVYNVNTRSGVWPPVSTVYAWSNGHAAAIGSGEDVKRVTDGGTVAVLTKHTVDLAAGQAREPGYDRADSAGGTVVYAAPSGPLQTLALFRAKPDGSAEQLAAPSAKVTQWYGWTLGYYGPLTDGASILYRELVVLNNYRDMKWALRLRGADGATTTLALNPWAKGNYYVPNDDYRLNGGWIAYTAYHKEPNSWSLYVRSPQGTEKTVFEGPAGWSFSATQLRIDELAPDGTVAFTFNGKSELYDTQADKVVSTAGGPSAYQYREHTFAGSGDASARYGVWYRVSGGSLYAVRP